VTVRNHVAVKIKKEICMGFEGGGLFEETERCRRADWITAAITSSAIALISLDRQKKKIF